MTTYVMKVGDPALDARERKWLDLVASRDEYRAHYIEEAGNVGRLEEENAQLKAALATALADARDERVTYSAQRLKAEIEMAEAPLRARIAEMNEVINDCVDAADPELDEHGVWTGTPGAAVRDTTRQLVEARARAEAAEARATLAEGLLDACERNHANLGHQLADAGRLLASGQRQIDEKYAARIADLEARLARVPDREAVARAIAGGNWVLWPETDEEATAENEANIAAGNFDYGPIHSRDEYRRLADAVLALFAAQETKP